MMGPQEAFQMGRSRAGAWPSSFRKNSALRGGWATMPSDSSSPCLSFLCHKAFLWGFSGGQKRKGTLRSQETKLYLLLREGKVGDRQAGHKEEFSGASEVVKV